jgi:glycyl-tRNA synthetase beta chain
MTQDILFELGVEELPSGLVEPLARELLQNLIKELALAKITHGEGRFFASPRRVAVVISAVATQSSAETTVKRGPRCVNQDDRTLPAVLGFAKSCKVGVESLTILENSEGCFWSVNLEQSSALTAAILPAMVNKALAALTLPKIMRWGDGDFAFARPVHWAVLLFGQEILKTAIMGIVSSNLSYGHRFHHPLPIVITSPMAYEAALEQAFVIADFAKRREKITNLLKLQEQQYGCKVIMPEALLDEVTSIVEWPEAVVASFAPEFLAVPKECLIAAMQNHQKTFAMASPTGKLLPQFVVITNIRPQGDEIKLGNEVVMRARLSDALFFYDTDKKRPLAEFIAKTKTVLYQHKLGSLFDKTLRIERLLQYFAKFMQLDAKHLLRAAELSKFDLVTGMVAEFPELEGLMGYYYALAAGETEKVASALHEQYLPKFANDALPASTLGLALSLSDRLDTLVAAFVLGQKPSATKDPFKLRRHAFAIIRILIATESDISLKDAIAYTLEAFGSVISLTSNTASSSQGNTPSSQGNTPSSQGNTPSSRGSSAGSIDAAADPTHVTSLLDEIYNFLQERLVSWYHSLQIPQDFVQAVPSDVLFDCNKRLDLLRSWVHTDTAKSVLNAAKRINNIVQKETSLELTLDESLLELPAEKGLLQAILGVELQTQGKDYAEILNISEQLSAPLEQFFAEVFINDEKFKHNRLALLARAGKILSLVADLGVIRV